MPLVLAFEKDAANVARAARLKGALAGMDARAVIDRHLARWHDTPGP